MRGIVFRPIVTWPEGWREGARGREYSRFDSSYQQTRELLWREITLLDAQQCVVQLDAKSSQITRDGQLKSGSKIEHPGVIVTVETPKYGPLVYSTDRFLGTYDRPAWQHNLRAIALGLEALRKIERYGIAERGQQYAGYRELGSGIPLGQEAAPSMTAEQAAAYMITTAGMAIDIATVLDDPDVADLAYKLAAKQSHPDVGGDPETFRKLGEARRIVALAYRR